MAIETVFYFQHPEDIANVLQTELNNIVDLIAPSYKINWKANYEPFITPETRSLIKERDKLLTVAFTNNDQDT